jgi:hypothetical protein
MQALDDEHPVAGEVGRGVDSGCTMIRRGQGQI